MKVLVLLISVFWCLAISIRFTVRDSSSAVASLVFYMSPLILLSLGAFVVFVLAWIVHWRRIAVIWFLLSIMTGIWCWNTQFRDTGAYSVLQHDPSKKRVLFWNIGDRLWGIEHVINELQQLDPDLIGLVEAGPDSAEMKQFWKQSFPEHPYQVVQNGFVFLSRLPITETSSGRLVDMGHYLRFRLQSDQADISVPAVFLVDIYSKVLKSRRAALKELADQVSQLNQQPVLVLGDFNTPRDSVHFDSLRKSCNNSLEIAGDGYLATWPLPIPVLDLDGIWVNEFIELYHAENRWTWVSDHRPVLIEMSFKTQNKKVINVENGKFFRM
ncbi:Endonuclease/Exonuclease/phosphatase family protein [Gimesia algae]|uniref:Endonuclease/Exonuclease/phosphatase family protein n=2 Tax=Gimesia algae TaxID=2527971 RepID=A0A517V988_9PLAN|nr:Endonuclease/Exonuclease/phosphatase family protein [Gimesia algae]